VRFGTVAGDSIGSGYRLVVPIGQGAMGTVWDAEGPAGRVAIKVLRADLTDDADIVDRFLRERAILLSLRSPHIVSVRDLVVEGDRLAIVMDLVDGADLRAILRRERTLPAARAIAIVRQVLEGLADAHAQGVVHRDVKPENVLVTLRGGVESIRLVDFGVARIIEHAATGATGVVGTPSYMAPEIAMGHAPRGSTDVYAAGVLLYEMLFSRPPFHGDTVAQVLHAQQTAKLVRPGGVPNPLWKVLRSMLARRPDRRPTAADAAEQLERLPATAIPASPFVPADSVETDVTTVVGDPRAVTALESARLRNVRRVPRWGIAAALVPVVGAGVWFGASRIASGGSTPCAEAHRFTAAAPRDLAGREVATIDSKGVHVGMYFGATFLGFGNRGLRGDEEERGMQERGALGQSLTEVFVGPTKYRSLPNRPSDGAVFREWKERRANETPAYFFAVGGTVIRTDSAALNAVGADPAAALLVPRYSLDHLEELLPANGTLFRMGEETYAIRRGHRVTVAPCTPHTAVRVPEAPSFLQRIPA
jgi:Serine/threonine protein kinase